MAEAVPGPTTERLRGLARELGVNLPDVKGSGPKNRVLHDDVKTYVKAILSGQAAGPAGPSLPETPKVDFAKFGELEEGAPGDAVNDWLPAFMPFQTTGENASVQESTGGAASCRAGPDSRNTWTTPSAPLEA